MKQRGNNDIWAGLYDFYDTSGLNFDSMVLDDISDGFLKEVLQKSIIEKISESYKHILTHQRIEARFIHLKLNESIEIPEGFAFFDNEEIEKLPKPILIEKYLKSKF